MKLSGLIFAWFILRILLFPRNTIRTNNYKISHAREISLDLLFAKNDFREKSGK